MYPDEASLVGMPTASVGIKTGFIIVTERHIVHFATSLYVQLGSIIATCSGTTSAAAIGHRFPAAAAAHTQTTEIITFKLNKLLNMQLGSQPDRFQRTVTVFGYTYVGFPLLLSPISLEVIS